MLWVVAWVFVWRSIALEEVVVAEASFTEGAPSAGGPRVRVALSGWPRPRVRDDLRDPVLFQPPMLTGALINGQFPVRTQDGKLA